MADLYYGCAVDLVLADAFDDLRGVRWARYVGASSTPGRVWLVCWRGQTLKPFWALADVSRVAVSSRPQEPPPMPFWALADVQGPTNKDALQRFILSEMGEWPKGCMPDRVAYNLSYSASFYAGNCDPAAGWSTVREWLAEVAEPFEAHDGRLWWKARTAVTP